jgi:hypothetical protein
MLTVGPVEIGVLITKGLDAKNINFGTKGIELSNLSLKKTALAGLELPIEIKEGKIVVINKTNKQVS